MAEEIPSVEEIRQLGEDVVETAIRMRGLELGYTSEHGPVPEGTPDVHPGAGTGGEWAAVRAGYAWIPDFFERNVGPDPAGFDGPIEVMQEAERKLYDHVSHILPIEPFILDLRDYLGSAHWDGTAAKNFRSNFLHRIEEVTRYQSAVAFTLKHAVTANKEIFIRVRRDLRDTARQTIAALEYERFLPCSPGVVAVALSVASAVAVVASAGAATPAVIAGWTFVAGMSSAAAGVFGSLPEPSPPSRDLAADTVNGVLQNMIDVVTEIQQEADRGEQDIVNTLRTDLDLMTSSTLVPFPDGAQRTTSEYFLAARPDDLIEQAERANDGRLPDTDRDSARDYVFENFEPQ